MVTRDSTLVRCMTSPLHFSNAPITEAVLDLRVQLKEGAVFEDLIQFAEAVAERYPEKRIRTSLEAKIHYDKETLDLKTEGTSSKDGYLMSSSDGRQVVQARLDGFTFSRLKPYQDWPTMRDEARALWTTYLEVAEPKVVNRIALRYINRVEIPLSGPPVDFKDYFLTAPEIASGISQVLQNFFMRLVVSDKNGRGTAIITETVDDTFEDRSMYPLIFDIDVFQLGSFQPDSEHIWRVFEQLRDLKNEIFTRTFTDKAKDLFR